MAGKDGVEKEPHEKDTSGDRVLNPAVLANLSKRQQPAESRQSIEPVVHVLVIEDDEHYFRLVKHMLKASQTRRFQVQGASSLAQASKILSSESPDAILLDLYLDADSDGFDSLHRVKAMSPETPIVILTGADDEKIGLESIVLGAQDYLVKQKVGDGSLVRCILYAIERHQSEMSKQRYTAIRDFIATLAHDLQVPMIGTGHVLEAALSKRFGELSPEIEDILQNLRKSNSKNLVLVQKLLEIYKFELLPTDFDFGSVHVERLLERCASDCIERLGGSDKPTISMQLPKDLPGIHGNEESLYRLFSSLIDNALKYGDGTSPVTLSGEVVGDKLAIHIHNAGQPIPEEVQSSLFSQFWQGLPGKTYVPNTGLGLYLCHRIVQLHHGKITCFSKENEGTTFTVVLPVSR